MPTGYNVISICHYHYSSQRSYSRSVFVVAVLVAALSGCGEEFQIANVSGRVTKNGKPIARVLVSFQPTSGTLSDSPGPGSYGVTDEEGHFELKLVASDRAGAVVGIHRVILKHREDVGETFEAEVKARFEDPDAPPADDKANMDAAIRHASKKSQTVPERLRNGSTRFEVPLTGTTEANFDLSIR